MDPITSSLLVGGGGELLGGIGGEIFGGRDRQRRAIEQALAELRGTNVEAAPTAYGSDADFLSALGAMRRGYESGGMSGADRLAQTQAMNDAATAARMRDEGVTQNLAQRGQLGGGQELAARLANSQNAVRGMYTAGAQGAGLAQQRALEQLRGWGGMAGQRASASDLINRFNASQRLGKAQAMLGAASGAANYYGGEAQRRQDFGAGLGRAAGGIAGYFYGNQDQEQPPITAPRMY